VLLMQLFGCRPSCCFAEGADPEKIEVSESGQDAPEALPLAEDLGMEAQDKLESAEAEPGLLTMSMTRARDEPIGLDADLIDGFSLVVINIKDGCVQSWNEQHQDPSSTIQVDDRIVQVNGIKSDAQALAAELHKTTTWELTISRPKIVSLLLEHRKEDNLGIDLRPSRGGMALLMANIGEGYFQQYLLSQRRRDVRKSDRIVAVNGTRGTSHQLLRALHAAEASTALALDVLHYEQLPDDLGEEDHLQARKIDEGGKSGGAPHGLMAKAAKLQVIDQEKLQADPDTSLNGSAFAVNQND